jgi:hypothetical protein
MNQITRFLAPTKVPRNERTARSRDPATRDTVLKAVIIVRRRIALNAIVA